MSKYVKLAISLLLPVAVGGLAGWFTQQSVRTWFTTIQKPAWNPPNWVFAPVWTVLYIMMGIAFYLIWKQKEPALYRRWAIAGWLVQLAANFLWSFLFFGQHLVGVALIDIAFLWVALLLTIFAFGQVSKAAAWLLVPYISWVTFAGCLNFAIYTLNN